jgi:hypothetical protein
MVPGNYMGPEDVLRHLLSGRVQTAYNSTTTKARAKNKHKSLEFTKNIDMYLTKFENNKTLLNKMSHLFLETTKLFSARNVPKRY